MRKKVKLSYKSNKSKVTRVKQKLTKITPSFVNDHIKAFGKNFRV